MIRSIRDEVSSWYMRLILILLVLSFVTFYGWSGSSIGAGNVTKVGGEALSVRDYQFRYQNALQFYQTRGVDVNNPDYLNYIQSEIVGSFVDERIKFLQAKKLGFVESQQEVRKGIQQSFSDAEGNFDFEFYKNYVRNRMGKTPALFEKEEAKRQIAQTYEDWVLHNTLQPPLELKTSYALNNTKREISFVRINPKMIKVNNTLPSMEEIETYYQDNPSQFMSLEKRKFEILTLSKASYESLDQQQFFEKADDIFALVAEDETIDFQSYASNQKNVSLIETDWVSYADGSAQLSQEDLSMILNASLSLNVTQKTQSLHSRDGQHAYLAKLTAIQSAQLEPLDSVKQKISETLIEQKNQEQIIAHANQTLQQAMNNNTTLQNLAKQKNWTVETTGLFSFQFSGDIPNLGHHPALQSETFKPSTQKNAWLPSVYQMDNDYILAYVSNSEEPDFEKFENELESLWTVGSEEIAFGHLNALNEVARSKTKIMQSEIN